MWCFVIETMLVVHACRGILHIKQNEAPPVLLNVYFLPQLAMFCLFSPVSFYIKILTSVTQRLFHSEILFIVLFDN